MTARAEKAEKELAVASGAVGARSLRRRRSAAIAFGLLLLTTLAYSRVVGSGFVTLDDGEYVSRNPHLRDGLTGDSLRWALTSFYAANWHPLTWLSHLTDVELFGLRPAGHHAMSLALHATNGILLFAALAALTGALWRPALVAALFSLHPLHVESVAWVAERKDLLCGFFWILTMLAYARWVRRGGVARYLAVVASMAFGVFAKPMIVTLPLALLLLDSWPLGRLRHRGEIAPRLWEKAPLFLLSALSAWMTVRAQSSLGATASLERFPLDGRIANALTAYAAYLRQTVWPRGLAAFYPHPATIGERIPASSVLAAVALLGGISAVATTQRRRRPWAVVGWLWFLGTLVPAIGLVQVGSQARADRYTYLPLMGLFVLFAWGLGELAERGDRWRAGVIVGASVGLLACAALTWVQTGYWRDSERLYRRALAVTEKNWLAWNNLGVVLLDRGDPGAALGAFGHAVEFDPSYAEGWLNVGLAREQLGESETAEQAFRQGLRLDASNPDGWLDLGRFLQGAGRFAEAEAALENVLRRRGDDGETLYRLAILRAARGDRAGVEALRHRLRAVDPEWARELETALEKLDRLRAAERRE